MGTQATRVMMAGRNRFFFLAVLAALSNVNLAAVITPPQPVALPTHSYCPDAAEIHPCKCLVSVTAENSIQLDLFCDEPITEEELEKVFNVEFPIEKFTIFYLDSKEIHEIGAINNNGITFDDIRIIAPLQSISSNFLNNTGAKALSKIMLYNTSLGDDDEFWSSLSLLQNLEKVSIEGDHSLTTVPEIRSYTLSVLRFSDCKNLKSISEGALANLPDTHSISIVNCALEGKNSFPNRSVLLEAGGSLSLDLSENNITGIDNDMFIFPQPMPTDVDLNLAYTQVEVLDRSSFQAFLNGTKCEGTIMMDSEDGVASSVACNCSLAWMFDNCDRVTTFQQLITGTCSDGTQIAELEAKDFANCTHSGF